MCMVLAPARFVRVRRNTTALNRAEWVSRTTWCLPPPSGRHFIRQGGEIASILIDKTTARGYQPLLWPSLAFTLLWIEARVSISWQGFSSQMQAFFSRGEREGGEVWQVRRAYVLLFERLACTQLYSRTGCGPFPFFSQISANWKRKLVPRYPNLPAG